MKYSKQSCLYYIEVALRVALVIAIVAGAYACRNRSNLKELALKIQYGDTTGVEKLIKLHPKLVNANLDSLTQLKPLDHAAAFGWEKICGILIAAGADVNARDQVGETPLFYAISSSNVVALLIQHGANVNSQDQDGRTPLSFAFSLNCTNAFVLLFQNGANPMLKDRYGKTLLDYANDKSDSKRDSLYEMILATNNLRTISNSQR